MLVNTPIALHNYSAYTLQRPLTVLILDHGGGNLWSAGWEAWPTTLYVDEYIHTQQLTEQTQLCRKASISSCFCLWNILPACRLSRHISYYICTPAAHARPHRINGRFSLSQEQRTRVRVVREWGNGVCVCVSVCVCVCVCVCVWGGHYLGLNKALWPSSLFA